MAPTFPFAAIVGQEEMRLAIQMLAVDPTIGGVLVLGDRSTGQSTAVRALADLLPPPSRWSKTAPTASTRRAVRCVKIACPNLDAS